MNKYQKSLIDFMKTGEIEIELKHLSQRQLIRLVEEQQQRIDKAIEYIENNQLYEEEWDYDSNDEPYSWGCNDTNASNELLSILRGEDNA